MTQQGKVQTNRPEPPALSDGAVRAAAPTRRPGRNDTLATRLTSSASSSVRCRLVKATGSSLPAIARNDTVDWRGWAGRSAVLGTLQPSSRISAMTEPAEAPRSVKDDGTPAPLRLRVHIREKLPEIVLEASSIVIAILLAFGVDEWREKRSQHALADGRDGRSWPSSPPTGPSSWGRERPMRNRSKAYRSGSHRSAAAGMAKPPTGTNLSQLSAAALTAAQTTQGRSSWISTGWCEWPDLRAATHLRGRPGQRARRGGRVRGRDRRRRAPADRAAAHREPPAHAAGAGRWSHHRLRRSDWEIGFRSSVWATDYGLRTTGLAKAC